MRSIKNPLKLYCQNNNKHNDIYLLSQYCEINKYTKENLGIILKEIDNNSIWVSNIERTLIELAVRPSYAIDLQSLLDIYSNARPYVNTIKLFEILKNLNYSYPYHQSIGFLLEHSGYPSQSLIEFKNLPMIYNFYIEYELDKNNLDFCANWKIYYPKNII